MCFIFCFHVMQLMPLIARTSMEYVFPAPFWLPGKLNACKTAAAGGFVISQLIISWMQMMFCLLKRLHHSCWV